MTINVDQLTRNITFIGRPADTNKGLATVFSAVECLTGLSGLPAFCLWIVGGEEAEIGSIRRTALAWSGLRRMHEEQRLIFWGRIEFSALTEIYSRSLVTLMASRTERFGRTAIEAMACGSPVVASRTGGLKEVVVDGMTGNLFDIDDAAGLAAIISGYLRNPDRAASLGENAIDWVRATYNERWEFEAHVAVYEGREGAIKEPLISGNDRLTLGRLSELRRQSVMIGRLSFDNPTKLLGNISHIVAPCRDNGRPAILKVFQRMPSMRASLFGDLEFGASRGPFDRIRRHDFHECNPISLPLLDQDLEHNAILLPLGERVTALENDPLGDDAIAVITGVTEATTEFGAQAIASVADVREEADAVQAACDAIGVELCRLLQDEDNSYHACHQLAELIACCDGVSERLNASLAGQPTSSPLHPIIELSRIFVALSRGYWAITAIDAAKIAVCIHAIAPELCELPARAPRLYHGAPKSAHILWYNGRVAASRWDNSAFTIHDIDLAVYVFNVAVLNSRAPNTDRAVDVLRRASADADAFIGRVAWLAVHAIINLLWDLSCGRTDQAHKSRLLVTDLPLAFAKVRASFR